MKTNDILRALRATNTPAARLAAWQGHSLTRRRKLIADLMGRKYCPAASVADARKQLIESEGVELSSPESETPYLWTSESAPEVSDYWTGRTFLDHCGWYTMDECCSETLETYAVTLAAFPHLIFYAVKDSVGDGLRVHLDEWQAVDYTDAGCNYTADECVAETAKEVIRSNDSSTEYEAEESREYYRKDCVEQDIEANRERLAELRGEIRALVRELKTLCPAPFAADYPAAGKALWLAVRGLLGEREELMNENARLAESI